MSKNVSLSLQNVKKSFSQGKSRLHILNGASLDIHAGEVIAMVGPSGSGKSTLLQCAGLLDTPDSGHIFINGVDCARGSDSLRTQTRRTDIGVVYQFHHLLPEFTALENVLLPQMIAGMSRNDATMRATEILKYLGLGKRLDHRPAELSGGEQQRVAIARAMVNRPAVLLADEPTGNLDPKTSEEVFHLLLDTARAAGLAVLIVTHNHELAKKADRRVSLSEGTVV